MPDNLNQIITVNISVQEAALAAANLSRPLIVGLHTRFPERGRIYSSAAAMLADGFLSTDQEYIDAVAAFSQYSRSGRKLTDIAVGRRVAEVAQVSSVTIVYGAGGTITVSLSRRGADPVVVNQAMTVDAPTTATALAGAINASAAATWVTAAPAAGVVNITSDLTGVPFVLAASSAGGGTATPATVTPNVGIAEDLDAIMTAGISWYCTIPTSRSERVIAEMAAWTEPQRFKIAMGQSNEAALLSAAYNVGTPYTDIGSELKTAGYNKTGIWYRADDAQPLAAAIMGYALPFIPGTVNYAHRRLVGPTADDLTATQLQYLTGTPAAPTSGKNVNVYIPLNNDGVNITLRGMMASGRFIDVQTAADYVQNQVEIAVANQLLAAPKIAFDDTGIQQIRATIEGVFASLETAGVLTSDREHVVNAPRSAQISSANKTARFLSPPITGSCFLSGALNNAQIDLTLVP